MPILSVSLQCERCLPLYNNKPFEAGNQLNPYPCKLCQCYNHSSSCIYNASTDLFPSDYDNGGGGVCVSCSHNTTGQMCDTCVAMSYRPNGKSLFAADVCLPCDCSPAGTLPDSMDCNKVPCLKLIKLKGRIKLGNLFNDCQTTYL